MSKCDELRKLLLEWGEDNYLPLKKKIAYLENENYRLRMQNLRVKERNERLALIVPLFKHVRATALTAAFIPGASPPEVKTPIHLTIMFTPYFITFHT